MGKTKYIIVLLVFHVAYSSGYVANNYKVRGSPEVESSKQTKDGSIASPKYKYPYQALLFAGDYIKCGATIINKRHALTADHCIRIDTPSKDTFVIVGHHSLSSNDVYGPNADEIFGEDLVRVEQFIRYEKRNEEDFLLFKEDYNDIAILRMEKDFILSYKVQPACIADNLSQYYIGWDAVVTGLSGWRSPYAGSSKSSAELKEVALKVLEPESTICYRLNPPDFRSGGFNSKKTKLCAYKLNAPDSCQGHSGGPLTVRQNGKFVLIGVVQSRKGSACSPYSGIFMRVAAFAEWIKKTAGDVCTSSQSDQTDSPIKRTVQSN